MDILNTLGDNVGVMDQEDGLKILNYNECGRDSPEDLKKVRGLVQETDTGNILFDTFPYTEEYNSSEEIPFFSSDNKNVLDEWNIYYSLEGCLMRVFWHKDRWYISTNKKLNAFKSRWASRKSFGDIFRDGLVHTNGNENVLEVLLDQLDKELVHLFLVRYNNENRVVCSAPKDFESVYFIGSWDDKTKTLDREWKHTIKVNIPMSIKEVPTTINDLANSVDIREHQGVILFHKEKNLQVKVYSDEYDKKNKIRGNNPNIRFRYLEIRKDPEIKPEFIKLYPLYEDLFLEYENIMYQLAKLIRYYYIQRYIKNKYVTLPKEEYILMKKCHDWYLLDRVDNKINVSKVLEILNNEETLALYKMIRRFQINQYNQDQHKNDNNSEIMNYPNIRNEPPRTPRSVVSMEILPDVED
jgi:hypothetical protein